MINRLFVLWVYKNQCLLTFTYTPLLCNLKQKSKVRHMGKCKEGQYTNLKMVWNVWRMIENLPGVKFFWIMFTFCMECIAQIRIQADSEIVVHYKYLCIIFILFHGGFSRFRSVYPICTKGPFLRSKYHCPTIKTNFFCLYNISKDRDCLLYTSPSPRDS